VRINGGKKQSASPLPPEAAVTATTHELQAWNIPFALQQNRSFVNIFNLYVKLQNYLHGDQSTQSVGSPSLSATNVLVSKFLFVPQCDQWA
jgi:hypothetical protein